MSSQKKITVWYIAAFVLGAAVAFAVSQARVHGIVKDEQGRPLAGVPLGACRMARRFMRRRCNCSSARRLIRGKRMGARWSAVMNCSARRIGCYARRV